MQRLCRIVQGVEMEVLVEYDGRRFNVANREERRQFDEYVASLPTTDEQYDVGYLALAAVDKKLRSFGFFCGIPLQDPERASQELYGYIVSGFVNTGTAEGEAKNDKPRLINRWRFKNKQGERGTVAIYEGKDGKRFHRVTYRPLDWQFRFERVITSLLDREKNNPFQAELKAQAKLRTLISERQYACYILSGAFVEAGKSGVQYLVRRGLPTIAFRLGDDSDTHVLTALCMKPIGGHQHSFAGVMVPTDEVITVVLLIQADEPDLWKRSNHLNIDDPISGL